MATILLTDTSSITLGGNAPIQVPQTTQPDPEFGFIKDGTVITQGNYTNVGPTGPQGIQGEQGEQGRDGRSILKVEQTAGDGSPGTIDTYTIFYTYDISAGDKVLASDVILVTSDFNNNLDPLAITNVQKLADFIDDWDISASGGTSTLVNEITSTITVGGIPSGTTYAAGTELELIIRNMLTPYQPPKITTFSLSTTPTGGQFEVGSVVNINSATIGISNDSDGNPPQNLVITGTGFSGSAIVGINNATPGTTVQLTTDSSQSWSVVGEDSNGANIPGKSVTLNWRFMHYVGGSSTILTSGSTDAQATTLLNSMQVYALRSNRSATVSTGSWSDTTGYYTYIGYASKYGSLSNILQNGSLPILGAFTEVGDFNFTNSQGHTESYKIYRSNSDKAFAVGTSLTIS